MVFEKAALYAAGFLLFLMLVSLFYTFPVLLYIAIAIALIVVAVRFLNARRTNTKNPEQCNSNLPDGGIYDSNNSQNCPKAESEKIEVQPAPIDYSRLRKAIDQKSNPANIGIKDCLTISSADEMQVIHYMEKNIAKLYHEFCSGSFSARKGKLMFDAFELSCKSSNLPLAAEMRLESLLDEYREKFIVPNDLCLIDRMDGEGFERWFASFLPNIDFSEVEMTKSSRDQGVDVIAEKGGIRYAFQCKCYSSNLGNTPIQEVYAGKAMYNCHVGVVVTNQYFTQGAKELANATGVLLWDRDKLGEMLGLTPDEIRQPKY